MRFLAAAAAGACTVAALTGCSSSSKAAAKDVTIAECKAGPTGGRPTASGGILNHSSKSSAYAIHVKFKDPAGNSVGDGVAAVAKVDSGTSAKWHATGTVSHKGPVKCSVSVTRTISP